MDPVHSLAFEGSTDVHSISGHRIAEDRSGRSMAERNDMGCYSQTNVEEVCLHFHQPKFTGLDGKSEFPKSSRASIVCANTERSRGKEGKGKTERSGTVDRNFDLVLLLRHSLDSDAPVAQVVTGAVIWRQGMLGSSLIHDANPF